MTYMELKITDATENFVSFPFMYPSLLVIYAKELSYN